MNINEKAARIIDEARMAEYGDAVRNMVRSAVVASATLGRHVDPEEYVLIHLAGKQVRAGVGDKEDTTIDVAGYADIPAEGTRREGRRQHHAALPGDRAGTDS